MRRHAGLLALLLLLALPAFGNEGDGSSSMSVLAAKPDRTPKGKPFKEPDPTPAPTPKPTPAPTPKPTPAPTPKATQVPATATLAPVRSDDVTGAGTGAGSLGEPSPSAVASGGAGEIGSSTAGAGTTGNPTEGGGPGGLPLIIAIGMLLGGLAVVGLVARRRSNGPGERSADEPAPPLLDGMFGDPLIDAMAAGRPGAVLSEGDGGSNPLWVRRLDARIRVADARELSRVADAAREPSEESVTDWAANEAS